MTATLALTDPRANNFNVLRLVASSAVIFSHAFEIAANEHDFFQNTIGYSGGWLAVSAFFSISGFLIYRSIVRSQSVRDYFLSRCLRILPGLWVMLILTTIVLGVFFSTIGLTEFAGNPQSINYLFGNGVLYFPRYVLPGVFEQNHLNAVNGSLWTLRFEFTCYLITLLLFLFGFYRSSRAFIFLIALMVIGYFGLLGLAAWSGNLSNILFDGSSISKLHRLWFAFFLGILVGRYIDVFQPRLWMVIASGMTCVVLFRTPFFATALIAFLAATLFWFAFLQGRWLEPFRRMHDYSYGIYIYAFPVQQAVAQLIPELSPFGNGLLSLAITTPLAALSWYFVEKPALALKPRLMAFGKKSAPL